MEPDTALSYRIDGVNKILEVRVDNAGLDFAGSIEGYDVPKAFQMTDVIMIYLNMNDPGCPGAYRYFREHGFIFTGCLPGSLAGDYLMLQHLQGKPILREKMVLEPNYRETLDRLRLSE